MTMSMKQHVDVRVTKRFDATPERVFDAWLDPEMIGKWMFGERLREEEIVRLSIDARVGGEFSFVVRRNGEELDHIGKYLELDRPRRLAFTWGVRGHSSPDDSRVSVEITPVDGGCELTLTHELHPDWASYAARAEAMWRQEFEVLADVVG